MLRAMDSAVSGLRAHQNKLDVIGNNIANVNTFGFKSHDKRMNDCLPPILFSAIFKLLKVLPDTELDAC